MDSIIQRLQSSNTPEQHSLDTLISLLEMEYPELEDCNDINTLRRLLVIEFGAVFTHEEIVQHLVVSLEEEDARLQYKHLNINVQC